MISVIIPIYNHIKEIGKCIDSIKTQTYKDIEVIFVEDGSTDASEDEYRELIANFHVPNSKFLFHKKNKSVFQKNFYLFFFLLSLTAFRWIPILIEKKYVLMEKATFLPSIQNTFLPFLSYFHSTDLHFRSLG